MAEQDIIIKIKATDEASPTVQAINEEIAGVEQKLLALKEAGKEASNEFKNLTQKQEELKAAAEGFNDLPVAERLAHTKEAMLELAAAGQANSEEFKKLKEEAEGYTQAMEHVEDAVSSASQNGSQGMKMLGEAASALTAGISVAQGIIALFGEENEDLQKIMTHVQGAMSLAMGVQKLVNLLTGESILMTRAYAAAQGVLTWATGASTVAMKAFRIALITTGVGALVVALGFLVSAMMDSKEKTEDATDYMKKYNKAVDEAEQKNRSADEAVRLLTAQMKLQGKSEVEVTREIYKHLKAREAEMIMDEARAKSALAVAKNRADALKMEVAAKKMLLIEEDRIIKTDTARKRELREEIKKLQGQVDTLLPEIAKAEAAINSMGVARKVGLAEAELAYNNAIKAANEEARALHEQRVDIAYNAHALIIKEGERALADFDKMVKKELKAMKGKNALYTQAEKDFATARIALIGQIGEKEVKAREELNQQIADAAMKAENKKFADQVIAIGKGNAEVRKKLREIGKVEEARLEKQIEIFRNNCLETSDLEIQLTNTIAANREAAYQDELADIQTQASKRETLIYKSAKTVEEANTMILVSNLKTLEDQMKKAVEYGQDVTDIEKQIAQIKLSVTDQILKDGKRRMDAAEQVRRNAMKIGADERKSLKLERQNALDDSEKLYNEDLKLYKDLLANKLIAEEDYTATVETLKDERRQRDKNAEAVYQQGLKDASSEYFASEIQSMGNMMKAVNDFRSAEYQRQIDQAQAAKEDEILQVEIQYKRGLITAETYERQKASITDRYDKMAEGYERKKFETDKQAAIAQALISTYLAGVQVLSNTKGGATARFLAMAAVITAGLAQVATISKTQFRSSTAGQMTATQSLGGSTEPSGTLTNPQTTDLSTGAMNAPGGASGGSGGGMASGGSQGSGSDSGNGSRNTEPVRAYVVERDIEQTSQRLRQISEFATL